MTSSKSLSLSFYGSSTPNYDLDLDDSKQITLNEMFIYKVLELLNVGPKVHFVFNEHAKYGVFIATEDLNT